MWPRAPKIVDMMDLLTCLQSTQLFLQSTRKSSSVRLRFPCKRRAAVAAPSYAGDRPHRRQLEARAVLSVPVGAHKTFLENQIDLCLPQPLSLVYLPHYRPPVTR